MRILKRIAAVAGYTAVGVFGSFPFLFAGTPYPDWCLVTSEGSSMGVLFFLPRGGQQLSGLALFVWCAYLG